MNPIYIVCIPLIVFAFPHLKFWGSLYWLGSTLVVVPLIVTVGAVSTTQNQFVNRAFDYLGWISYPIYCLHLPVYLLFVMVTGKAYLGLEGPLLCAVLTIALSHGAATYIDKPLREAATTFFYQSRQNKLTGLLPEKTRKVAKGMIRG